MLVMPRPTIDLQPYKGVITSWFHEGLSASNISKRLLDECDVVCTYRTIERRLRDWGTTKRARVKETAALRIKIANMFYMNFSDDIIVRSLRQEGYTIRKTTVERIRIAQGCKRRMTVWERAEANEKL